MSSVNIYYLFSFAIVIGACVCLELFGINTAQKGSKVWDMHFKRIESCKNQGTREIDLDLHLRKISRTRVDIEGNVTFKFPFGDNIKMVFDLSSWGNGGWKRNAYRFTITEGCSDFSVFAAIFKEIREKSGMDKNGKRCPIPAGRYELKGFDTKLANNLTIPFYNIPTMWKVAMTFYRKNDNRILACTIYIVESKVNSKTEDQTDAVN